MSIRLEQGTYLGEKKFQLCLSNHIITVSNYQAHKDLPLHYHENMVIGYVQKGMYHEKISKRLFTYSEGSLIIQPQQVEHKNYFSHSPAQCLNIEFTKAKTDELKAAHIQLKQAATLKSTFINNSIHKIMSELTAIDSLSELVIDALTTEILVYTLRHTSSAYEKPVTYRLKKIKDYLDEHYTSSPSLKDLSTLAGISSFHLSREFKKSFGYSIGNYIRDKRIDVAISKLKKERKSISEVAYECGFADASHFIRVFKKRMGVTPVQFLFKN